VDLDELLQDGKLLLSLAKKDGRGHPIGHLRYDPLECWDARGQSRKEGMDHGEPR